MGSGFRQEESLVLLTDNTIASIIASLMMAAAALFSLSRRIDRLQRRSSEQTEQILELQHRLGLSGDAVDRLEARVGDNHENRLDDLDDRLGTVEWRLKNLTDD